MSRNAVVAVLLVLAGVGCGPRSSDHLEEVATSERASESSILQAEVFVARDMLGRYAKQAVVVDSVFAVAEQAPGAPSGEVRPRSRTEALLDSLASPDRNTGPPLVLRLSKPRIAGTVARITVTIDFPDNRQPGGRGYETVDYTLDSTGGAWRLGTRVQLGIT
jgi:hypothetical protein